MSDEPVQNRRIERLRRIAEQSLATAGTESTPSQELWDFLEQMETENEELKRSRDELEQLHRRFADLYEHAPVGYLLLNEKRIIVQANETARAFLGARPIDLRRTALGPFIRADCQDEYFRTLRDCRKSGEPMTAEICIDREEEGLLWLEARVSCGNNGEGALNEYRIILSDITERIAAQQNAADRRVEVEQLLEEKELLLREIHHRLKNDFSMIGSFLSLQGMGSDNPEIQAAMDEARSRVHVMSRIYEILHRGQRYSSVELHTMVEEIAGSFKAGAAGHAVRVKTDLEEVEVPTATSLSVGLLLNELLTNASKYAFHRVQNPEITVLLRTRGDAELELTVADNGTGLPAEVIDGRRRGFGLTVANTLAQQHNGSLLLDNESGAVVRARMRRE